MGTWGARIYEDDTALDIRADFLERHKTALAVGAIEKEILDEYLEQDVESDDVVWLALCCVELETATLTDRVKRRALAIIATGRQYDFWLAEAGPRDAGLRKREMGLIKKYIEGYDGKPIKRQSWLELQKGDATETDETPGKAHPFVTRLVAIARRLATFYRKRR